LCQLRSNHNLDTCVTSVKSCLTLITLVLKPLFERDGRCVQNLIDLHHNILIYDY